MTGRAAPRSIWSAARTTRRAAVLVAACLLGACAGTHPLPELARAERHEHAGQSRAALADYRAAQVTCQQLRDPLRRRRSCDQAYLGEAETLVDLDRRPAAAAAFDRAARVLAAADPPGAARALLRAGQLELDLGRDKPAYRHLWQVVTSYPDQAFAADALVVLLGDGRHRAPQQLYQVLIELDGRLGATQISDNLELSLADLAEHERADPRLALSWYDRIVARHPESGLYDDALWRGAHLARQLGDGEGAVQRLRRLLATREVSWGGAGSYFSVWLDDAQLELGVVLRDDLHRPREALAAFAQLPRDYPASTLRDDALWQRAITLQSMGDPSRACAALAELGRQFPDSRWEIDAAPARRRTLGCAGHSR